ncbi:hypothetical protein F5Y13DRAFT_202923 [Hypoxylon sp. FL1857]|nr:hypothetical protein F5Y13DRAFT_202923 [Hypoxylon sp. FL1857]
MPPIEISHTCRYCNLERGPWHIPQIIAEVIDYRYADDEPLMDVLCLYCQVINEEGAITALSAMKRAPREIFDRHPEWQGPEAVLKDLIRFVGNACETTMVDIPKSIEEHLLKVVYRWRHDISLSAISVLLVNSFPCADNWREEFLHKLAHHAWRDYMAKLSTRLDHGMQLRIRDADTSAEVDAIFRDLDRLARRKGGRRGD